MRLFYLPLALLLLLLLLVRPALAIEVQRVTSPGGIEAWLVQDHANPMLSMRFSFRGGASGDPDDRQGLARMAAATIDEGAGDLDSQAFQQRLEELALTISFEAHLDEFGGRLRSLSENLDEAIDLMRLALTQPRFDPEPVERIRAQILAALRRNSTDPADIAFRELMRTLFPDHAYSRPSDGTEEGVAAVTRDDLLAFVAANLVRDRLVIGVAGDVTPERLGGLLDRAFGALPAGGASLSLSRVSPKADGRVVTHELDMPQSRLVFAQEGVMRDDPDFYAAFVLNHILGGGSFTSRLYSEVREKRGLAYSVGSYLAPYDHASLLAGSVGTAAERAHETMKVVRDEWQGMAEKGVTAEELREAKLYLTGSFPLRFSDSDRIAAILVAMQRDNLGIDFLDRRNGYIEAVDLKGINELAHRLLRPDRLTWVVVGKRETGR